MRVAADIVLRSGNKFLFIRRGIPPFQGMLAFPGGGVEDDETVEAAAIRELAEETGVRISEDQLRLLGVFSRPDRDPRCRVISIAYGVTFPGEVPLQAGSDAAAALWLTADDAVRSGLAFDHVEILERAR